jgi:hypothetical protein
VYVDAFTEAQSILFVDFLATFRFRARDLINHIFAWLLLLARVGGLIKWSLILPPTGKNSYELYRCQYWNCLTNFNDICAETSTQFVARSGSTHGSKMPELAHLVGEIAES